MKYNHIDMWEKIKNPKTVVKVTFKCLGCGEKVILEAMRYDWAMSEWFWMSHQDLPHSYRFSKYVHPINYMGLLIAEGCPICLDKALEEVCKQDRNMSVAERRHLAGRISIENLLGKMDKGVGIIDTIDHNGYQTALVGTISEAKKRNINCFNEQRSEHMDYCDEPSQSQLNKEMNEDWGGLHGEEAEQGYWNTE